MLFLLLFVLFKSCNKAPAIPTVEQRKYDSLLQVNKEIDSVYKESLYRDSLLLTQYDVNDSLLAVVDTKDRSLEVSKAKVALLLAKAAVIPKKDTAAQMDNCDSLRREALYLTENVADYQKATDQLSNQNVELVYKQKDLIRLKDSLFVALRASTSLLEDAQSNCLKQNEKLTKKSNRKFSIGPSIGVTYWDNKVVAVGGISLVYSLIKF